MLTYHILEYLRVNGFGTAIDTDLHFGKLPLGKYGIGIYSRGGLQASGRNSQIQSFDLYFRGNSDTLGADKADKVSAFLASSEDCELPTIPGKSNRQYKNCRFLNVDLPETLGEDENDRILYRVGAKIKFKKG